jgi:asparagine synthase (glutamine-hydrolysing)
MLRYANAWTAWKRGSLLPPELRMTVDGTGSFVPLDKVWKCVQGLDPMDRLFYLDLAVYLPYDLQFKMDIASMASSLEVRAPFLDYRLVELAARIPPSLKIKNGETKVLLRKLSRKYVPAEIAERGKMGFSVPIGKWLRGELREMLTDLLLDQSSRQRGFFRQDIIGNMIESHLYGTRDFSRHLWLIMIFELWHRSHIDDVSIP